MYGWQELAMLSKCANPECSEIFKYLHQGKIFRLAPVPEVEPVLETTPSLHERFWLCDNCSKRMTVVCDGTQVKLAPPSHPDRTGGNTSTGACCAQSVETKTAASESRLCRP